MNKDKNDPLIILDVDPKMSTDELKDRFFPGLKKKAGKVLVRTYVF